MVSLFMAILGARPPAVSHSISAWDEFRDRYRSRQIVPLSYQEDFAKAADFLGWFFFFGIAPMLHHPLVLSCITAGWCFECGGLAGQIYCFEKWCKVLACDRFGTISL